jgi:ketosteroid isomerase-like protein
LDEKRTRTRQSARRWEERLALRLPRLAARLQRGFGRLPPGSRLRRAIVGRAVRLGIDATNRGDYEAAFALYDPDIELLTPPDLIGLGEARRYRGRDERVAFQGKWTADWGEFRFGVDKIVDLGDRVLLIGWMRGSGLSSGAAFEGEWANLLTLSSGRVVREQYFPSHREGLEAAGLPDEGR